MMSVPGVGPITALAFHATVDQPDRFQGKLSNAVASSPARLSTKRLIRCLCSARKGRASERGYERRQAARYGPRARVAVARKLAVILHGMWMRWDRILLRQGTRPHIGMKIGKTNQGRRS